MQSGIRNQLKTFRRGPTQLRIRESASFVVRSMLRTIHSYLHASTWGAQTLRIVLEGTGGFFSKKGHFPLSAFHSGNSTVRVPWERYVAVGDKKAF